MDLIIANILLAPLITLKERFRQLLNQNGKLVISGLLEEQAPILINNYKPVFSLVGQEHLNDWSLLIFAVTSN